MCLRRIKNTASPRLTNISVCGSGIAVAATLNLGKKLNTSCHDPLPTTCEANVPSGSEGKVPDAHTAANDPPTEALSQYCVPLARVMLDVGKRICDGWIVFVDPKRGREL